MFNTIKDLKLFIQKYVPESKKIIISIPVLGVDKTNANDINKRYNDLLKEANVDCIFNDNVTYSNIDQYGHKVGDKVGGKVDILLLSETKIDGAFPTSQFLMSGYSNVQYIY